MNRMSQIHSTARRAFTLVEIMIVVLIIGILLAIAVPNFVRARESSRAKSCIANLTQIAAAKEQWALDNKQATGAVPVGTDLYGVYTKEAPSCPANGVYTINGVGTDPTCSIGVQLGYNNHVLP